MALRVQGIVQNIEHNNGTMKRPDGDVNWATAHVEVDGERVKYRIRQDGTMPVELPAEGDEVLIAVAVGLKENAGNLLHPFSLSLTAQSQSVLRTAAEVDEARGAALAAVPGQGRQARTRTATG